MECLWFGENEKSFFKYEELLKIRKVSKPIYPKEAYDTFPSKLIQYPTKQPKEIRILAVDIAVMSSKKHKNDATAIYAIQLIPTDSGHYLRNVVYSETHEGGHSSTQAQIVRRLYEQLDCDYIVLDTGGAGTAGVFDSLVEDMVDELTGEEYPALSCMNDSEMASRYKGTNPSPPKVIFSVKASEAFNGRCATKLRDVIKRGKMRLLIDEKDFEEAMNENPIYKDLSLNDKLTLKMPYIQTTLTIRELINLECTSPKTNIKIKETGTNRKDRYSSLSYGNYFADELERKLRKPKEKGIAMLFDMRPPKLRSY